MTCTRPAARPALACAGALGALLLGPAPGAAQEPGNCAPIRDGIEARIRAGGVQRFTLQVVDAGASAPGGRVVGRCDNGRRLIVYRAAAGTSATDEPMLTECRDGSVVRGGDCPRR